MMMKNSSNNSNCDEKSKASRKYFQHPISLNADDVDVDVVDGLPRELTYTNLDVFVALVTIICFYADFFSDIALAFRYYFHAKYLWFSLTLAFVAVPSISNSILNFYFYYQDYKRECQQKDPRLKSPHGMWLFRFGLTILQMGPVCRNVESIRYGHKSLKASDKMMKQYYYQWMLREDADACLLRLFECFMESAPQMTLQLYLLVDDPPDGIDVLRIISPLFSWLSASWSLVSYHRALRFARPDRANQTLCGVIGYFLWRALEVGPRIIVFSMFITEFYEWILLPIGIHWLIMFFWFQCQKLEFCINNVWQTFFNMLCALVSVFCYINVKDGRSRYRVLFYYFLFFAENFTLFAIWFRFTTHMGTWYHLTTFFAVLLGAILQMMHYCCYYYFCHPTRNRYICIPFDKYEMFESLCFSIPNTEKVNDKPPNPPFVTAQHNSETNSYQSRSVSMYSSYPETDVTDGKKPIDSISDTLSKKSIETGV